MPFRGKKTKIKHLYKLRINNVWQHDIRHAASQWKPGGFLLCQRFSVPRSTRASAPPSDSWSGWAPVNAADLMLECIPAESRSLTDVTSWPNRNLSAARFIIRQQATEGGKQTWSTGWCHFFLCFSKCKECFLLLHIGIKMFWVAGFKNSFRTLHLLSGAHISEWQLLKKK